MNKHWEFKNGTYQLYFCHFYDDELVASLWYNNEEKDWQYKINIYKNLEYGWLYDEELSSVSAKEKIESHIEDYISDEINYFKDMLDKWLDK